MERELREQIQLVLANIKQRMAECKKQMDDVVMEPQNELCTEVYAYLDKNSRPPFVSRIQDSYDELKQRVTEQVDKSTGQRELAKIDDFFKLLEADAQKLLPSMV